jgi:hypothetical protein
VFGGLSGSESYGELMWVSIVGQSIGLFGLAFAALALLRAWNSADGRKYRFWTDEIRKPSPISSFGGSAIGFATATLHEPTEDIQERVRRIEEAVTVLQGRLASESQERDRSIGALGDRIEEIIDIAVTKANKRVRKDTRLAVFGLGVVVIGSALQLVGTVIS